MTITDYHRLSQTITDYHRLSLSLYYIISFQTFPLEYPVFMKEHHDGKYRVDVYFICKMLAEVKKHDSKP